MIEKRIVNRFVLLTCLVLFCVTPSFGSCYYSSKCAPKAYDLSSPCGQFTSKVTGMTFLSEKIAQTIIKKELKKETKDNFKVEMKSYSANDLLHGRFKSLKISGKNLNIEGVYLTSFDAKTVCDFNYLELNKKSIKFKENMVLDYNIEIADKDLKKTVKSAGYLNMLSKVNLSACGITFFKLEGADVQIKNSKLYFTIKVTPPMTATPIPVVVRTDLKVEDGKIVLTKFDFVNPFMVIDLSKAAYILNVLNPLTFSTSILNNNNSEMKIQNVDIVGDKIVINGNVFIPKNTNKV